MTPAIASSAVFAAAKTWLTSAVVSSRRSARRRPSMFLRCPTKRGGSTSRSWTIDSSTAMVRPVGACQAGTSIRRPRIVVSPVCRYRRRPAQWRARSSGGTKMSARCLPITSSRLTPNTDSVPRLMSTTAPSASIKITQSSDDSSTATLQGSVRCAPGSVFAVTRLRISEVSTGRAGKRPIGNIRRVQVIGRPVGLTRFAGGGRPTV